MTTQYTAEFNPLDAEMWLAKRITQHLSAVFIETTSRDIRKERIRRAIIAGALDVVILGRHAGKPETYTQAFERLYGEPLQPKKSARGLPAQPSDPSTT
jgi:hypothetical protein